MEYGVALLVYKLEPLLLEELFELIEQVDHAYNLLLCDSCHKRGLKTRVSLLK